MGQIVVEVSRGFIDNISMNIKPYKKISGKWHRAKCNNCGTLIQKLHQNLCKTCWVVSIQGDSKRVPSRLGAKLSIESKVKISQSRKGKGLHPGINFSGQSKETHHNWKGGISPKNMLIRNSFQYKEWRKAVFERDNYTCQECGVRGGVILNADHIKPFALFPGLRFELNNGRTLCKSCHLKTPTHGRRKEYVG